MRSRSGERQDKNIIFHTVDQQPVRENMAFPGSHPICAWNRNIRIDKSVSPFLYSIRTQDEKSELTDSKDTYYDSKGNFVRKEVVKSNYNENGEVVSYIERFTEDDRKTGEYEKTEHLDGTVTQHETTLDENGDVLKEFHSQRDADGKIRNVTVTDMKTGERTETTYDADGKGYTKVYDKDNNLINEYPTTLLPPGSVPSNREDGTKEDTEKENPDQKPDDENKPDEKGDAENKPAEKDDTENKSDEKGDDKGTNTPGNTDGSKENTVKDSTNAVTPMKTPNADTADRKESPKENPVEKPAENPETPAEEQQKRSS